MKILCPLFALLLSGTSLLSAQTASEIVHTQSARHRVANEVTVIELHLTDRSGAEQTRTLRRSDKTGDDQLRKSLVVFTEPADISGTALLTWEHEDTNNDQWLYLPSRGRLLRVAQGRRDAYFMGTDFTYEDMDPDDLDDYTYELAGETEIDGATCYIIDARPVEAQSKRSAYSRRRLFIEKERLLTWRIEFYGHGDTLLKTQANAHPVQISDTAWRMDTALVVNKKDPHETKAKTVSRQAGTTLDDSTFSERHILTGRYME